MLLRHPSGQEVVAKRIRVDAQLADKNLSKIKEEVLLWAACPLNCTRCARSSP